MKRRRLELADAALHASHGPKSLSTCPLCVAVARRNLHSTKKEASDFRESSGAKGDARRPAAMKLPPLRKDLKDSKSSTQQNVNKTLKTHLPPISPPSIETTQEQQYSNEITHSCPEENTWPTEVEPMDAEKSPYMKMESDDLAYDIATQIVRQCLMEIASVDWETNIQGLIKMTDVLRYSPHLVSESGDLVGVVRSLTCLVGSQRPKVAIAACRASSTLFKRIACTGKTDFDYLVGALLLKSCDNNRFVRHEADRALDAMAAYVPAYSGVRAIIEQGGRHSNASVRAAAARVLDLLAEYQGAAALLDAKETRDLLCPTLASLVDDELPATRDYALHTCEGLSHDQRFTRAFARHARSKRLYRAEKVAATFE